MNDIDEFLHWYQLSDYLEKDKDGFIAAPWVLVEDAPEWCNGILVKWNEQKEKGFKVP